MTTQVTTTSMKLRDTHVVRKTEQPIGVGTGTLGQASLCVQPQFSGDKSAYWLRFAVESADIHTHMTGLGWRYVESRDAYWAYTHDKSSQVVFEMTGIRIGTPAQAPAPKAAPVKKSGTTGKRTRKTAKPKATVTPAPAHVAHPAPKRTLADIPTAELLEKVNTRMREIELMLAEIAKRA